MWLLLSAVALGEAKEDTLCQTAFDQWGASFELNSLILHGDGFNYHVKDDVDSVERNYTYIFNVCANVGHIPHPSCSRPDGLTVPAYQVDEKNSGCHRLAGVSKDVDWSLLDENDPTYGVGMTYLGGDVCPSSQKDRSITLKFVCANKLGFGEFESERVLEDECHYSLEVKTIFGCPRECPVASNRQLCGGNGFCGFDYDAKRPGCFCNKGWGGADCFTVLEPSGSSITGTGALLIMVNILLLALLVAGGYVFWKVRRLRLRQKYDLTDAKL